MPRRCSVITGSPTLSGRPSRSPRISPRTEPAHRSRPELSPASPSSRAGFARSPRASRVANGSTPAGAGAATTPAPSLPPRCFFQPLRTARSSRSSASSGDTGRSFRASGLTDNPPLTSSRSSRRGLPAVLSASRHSAWRHSEGDSMIHTVLSIFLALWLAALALPLGADAATVITGIVRTQNGQPLAGLVLLEKGEIHNNRWDRGTLVDVSGRFRIERAEGCQYGLHVYSSGYIYKPNAVKVESDKTLEVEVVLVPEPTRANDPVIKRVEFVTSETRKGKTTIIKMEITDPNGDLGPQVLAFNAATGRAFAMAPPRWVWSLKSNYPDGVYQLEVDISQSPTEPRDWHSVLADPKCNTADILGFPRAPKPPQVIRP